MKDRTHCNVGCNMAMGHVALAVFKIISSGRRTFKGEGGGSL
jgi:hypothetical protein